MPLETSSEHFDNIVNTFESAPELQAAVERPMELNEVYRSCSTSLNTLMRKDFSSNIKRVIMNNIQDTIYKVTGYMFNFSEIVCLTMLLLKNGGFSIKNGAVVFDQTLKGLDLVNIFPHGFVLLDKKSSLRICQVSLPPQSISKL